MPLSFRFTETMRGQHHFVDPAYGDSTDRLIWFRLNWGAPLLSALNPFSPDYFENAASGSISVQGLTSSLVPCEGHLRIDYLRHQRITYELNFENKNERFCFIGEKVDVDLRRPIELIKTHTTCYGAISNANGKVISKSVVHFPLDTTLRFLRSLRVTRA